MGKGYIIAIILLSLSLLVGVIVLVRQNKGSIFASGQISRIFDNGRDWVQINPRQNGGANEEGAQASTKEADTAKTNNPKISVGKGIAPQKPAITWCTLVSGAKPQRDKVIFNEIAWMGTIQSYSDEWMEVKNITSGSVDMAGWQIQNKSKKISIRFPQDASIAPQDVFLMERTDDDSVPGVSSGLIYTGSLANAKEALYLFDAGCQLQDSVEAVSKWPAGNNATKQTMQRTPSLGWQTGAFVGGTPGK